MRRAGFLGAACALLLVACGDSPPSDEDMRAATMAQMTAMAGKEGADMLKAALPNVKAIHCAKADAGGCSCDYVNLMGLAANGRFVRTDAGWRVIAGASPG